MHSEDNAIEVSSLNKTFKLPHEKHSTLKSSLINFKSKRNLIETQHVLNDISFEVKKGEFFGIVGKNGSGKSTLLKILAGIYRPTNGQVRMSGKLTPFIELGVGFSPELTGRENIFLNGALLGFSRKEVTEMYEEIVDFAELEKFMDQKLKNYSSGMQVRLAFSIAIRAKTEILLLDEVLAVGDAGFQKKCFDYFLTLKKQDTTVILVTHDMSSVERFCDRVLVIHNSQSKGVMTPGEAATFYGKINAEGSTDKKKGKVATNNRWGSGKVKISKIQLISDSVELNDTNITLTSGSSLTIKLKFKADKNRPVVVGLAFIDQYGANISGPNSIKFPINTDQQATYHLNKLPFARGEYSVIISVFDEDVSEEYDHFEKAAIIKVVSPTEIHGKVDLYGDWSTINEQ